MRFRRSIFALQHTPALQETPHFKNQVVESAGGHGSACIRAEFSLNVCHTSI